MKIYTKTGDYGETGLVGGARVSKSHICMDAIGNVDELNAMLGVVLAGAVPDRIANICQTVQHHLFNIGALLATPANLDSKVELDLSIIADLEKQIDSLQQELEPLRQFILPGGCESAAQLHLARTITRRAERSIIRICDQGTVISDTVLAYMNRLSDFLFVAARWVNRESCTTEQPWNPNSETSE